MTVNDINEVAISDTCDFEQDERSSQPLIYFEYVLDAGGTSLFTPDHGGCVALINVS